MNDNLKELIENKPEHFSELTANQQEQLVSWCLQLEKIKSFNSVRTSYGLKHDFQYSPNGFYVTNGQFKGAMLKAGFSVKDTNSLNWIFNISKKSLKKLQSEKTY